MQLIDSVDIGDEVICDYCNRTITDDDKDGCFVGSYAVCPDCAKDIRVDQYLDKDIEFVSGSFRQAVLKRRNGNNRIEIWSD